MTQCPLRLPITVYGYHKDSNHTLITLNYKIYLIGAFDGSNRLNKIWKGSFDKLSN